MIFPLISTSTNMHFNFASNEHLWNNSVLAQVFLTTVLKYDGEIVLYWASVDRATLGHYLSTVVE